MTHKEIYDLGMATGDYLLNHLRFGQVYTQMKLLLSVDELINKNILEDDELQHEFFCALMFLQFPGKALNGFCIARRLQKLLWDAKPSWQTTVRCDRCGSIANAQALAEKLEYPYFSYSFHIFCTDTLQKTGWMITDL